MVRRFRLLLLVLVVASSFLVVAPVSAGDPACTITGTEADDVLSGTAGGDVICGLGGNDVIDAGGGDDVVFGGTGSDVIHGGEGDDELHGNEDNDEIHGDAGDDWLGGGQGDDTLFGGDGADVMYGKLGADTLHGGAGNDELHGNEDNDEIHGDAGDDWLGGGQGDDTLFGGDGADVMYGKLGTDVLYGGVGDDELHGNENPDVLFGDEGDDWLGGGKGADEVHGGDGDDVLVGKKGDDVLLGGAGVDAADGSEGVDTCASETTVNCEVIVSGVTIESPAEGAVVFHAETVTVSVDSATAATVDLEVDGVMVDTSAVDAGAASFAWATTDHADGGVVLGVVVRDAQGSRIDAVSIGVTIANDDSSTFDRILLDYGQGLIDADMFVESAFATILGSGVESRYESDGEGLSDPPADVDDVGEATQLALSVLAEWPNLSPAGQAAVSSMGVVGGPISGVSIPAPPEPQQTQQRSAGDTLCLGSTEVWTFLEGLYSLTSAKAKAFECRTVFDHSVVYWNRNGGEFEADNGATLRKDRLADQDDLDGNGTPDQIDLIGGQHDVAWGVYDNMDYEQPASVDIFVHDMGYAGANVAALVLPTFVQYDSRLNQTGEQRLRDILPRHEQFHVAQFGTLDVSYREASVLPGSVRWWMEATAEWAAHQVNEAAGPGSGEYYLNLDYLLDDPETSLVEEPGFYELVFGPGSPMVVQVPLPPTQRAYGTFILAEYLDENLTFENGTVGGDDAVKRTFIRIRDGFNPLLPVFSTTAQQAIHDVIVLEADDGHTLSSVLTGFAVDNYLMDEPTGDGYTDPDADEWRNEMGRLVPPDRPQATEVALTDGVPHNGSYGDLNRGGAHYVEYTTAGGAPGTITLTVNDEDNVEYRALRIADNEADGPNLCAGAADIIELTPGVAEAIPVDGSCPKVTLVAVYADLDDQDRSVSWQALFEPGSVTRLVAQGSQYLWEYDGSVWTQLPALPGVDPIVLDIETVGGEVFALVYGPTTGVRQVMRLTDGGAWVVAGDMAYPASRPRLMAATGDHLYLLTEDGVTTDRVGVWRYDSDLSWTRVADIEGQPTGLAPTAVGGDDQVVFVVEFDLDPLNPTRSTIWAWSETDGLRQGAFETASGPEPVLEGRLGMRASVDYGAEFIMSTSGGGFISTTDGLSWTFMAEPLGRAGATAVHDGLMVFSDHSWSEAGVQEEPIRTWDGTTTQILTDPNLDMAWTSFQSDGTNLWMAGWRDIDDYSQDPVEGGVYRSTNGIDRVSVTTGIPDLDGIIIGEILLLDPTP